MYTAEQVRGLDQCAIEGHGIPGMELMENAGRFTFELARDRYPSAEKYLVLCGGGNNGGDGYVVARLALEAGLQATVCALKEPAGLHGDAATAAARWLEAGGEVLAWPMVDSLRFDLVFDALLGTGLDREPAGSYGEAVDFINSCGKPVIAVDIPSGLNADSGVAMGKAVRAQHSATFIGRKRGLYTADGPDHAGKVMFSDLQTPQSVADSEPDYGILVQESLIRKKLPRRQRNSHKGSFGWVLAVGGNHGMSGAVRLAGEAALRSGAGKVTVATRTDHAPLVNVACPELMVRGVDTGEQLNSLVGEVSVIVTGTGLGQSAWSGAMLKYCVASGRPLVIDADGLNLLAGDFQGTCLPPSVLTPHPAEAARLLGLSSRDVQADRVGAAKALAHRYQAMAVLKGCGTVVADPSGRYAICPYGNPGMATAGSGDVLAGVIAAMVAQGLDLWDASLVGVLAHALAGDLAASRVGERGLIASDITSQLPLVLNPR
ncbi:NAD(P)H-hydrate dehydratase [Pseudomonadota bacterium]